MPSMHGGFKRRVGVSGKFTSFTRDSPSRQCLEGLPLVKLGTTSRQCLEALPLVKLGTMSRRSDDGAVPEMAEISGGEYT
jgi:hypothetical protein